MEQQDINNMSDRELKKSLNSNPVISTEAKRNGEILVFRNHSIIKDDFSTTLRPARNDEFD